METTFETTQRTAVLEEMANQSFLVLATTSAEGRPHAAGVVYALVDGTFYLNTHGMSVKARNIRENPNVAINIAITKYPVGPPLTVQFQATAELLPTEDPEIQHLLAAGKLTPITSHGELENPGGCFVRVTPHGRYVSYGIGISLEELMADPLNAIRAVAV